MIGNHVRNGIQRRNFLKQASLTAVAGCLPVSLVELAFGKPEENVRFAYISDSHIEHIRGNRFVRDWDRSLRQAVTEANRLVPRADFVVFGGDLAESGTKPELDHGAEILSGLNGPVHHVMGEHDYYLDLGEYWSRLFGRDHYSFDVKGVHFVVLNSILTCDEWTRGRWPTAGARMNAMAGLDNPKGSPFMVGEQQRAWLRNDLAGLSRQTPVVVFSHAPLQKIHKAWNFWTDDAELVQEILQPFDQVTVLYGHVHQMQASRIGNIRFQSVMATAWPWPDLQDYSVVAGSLPTLTIPTARAGTALDGDSTGWQFIDVSTGKAEVTYLRPGGAMARPSQRAG